MKFPACTIILFGATGDLAKKKLLPAFADMKKRGQLHAKTRIIAIGRRPYTTPQYLKAEGVRGPIAKHIIYHELEFSRDHAYTKLKELLGRCDPNRLFYLATPQDSFHTIIEKLAQHKIAQRKPAKGWHRVVFEKPFGSDLASAKRLNATVGRLFSEEQIFRIDHYLGKGLVQEIFALRFANPIFESLWNAEHIDNVQFVISEKLGVTNRAEYYDGAGALRDIFQNHLLQLVSLIAMERPDEQRASAMNAEKVKVLRAIKLASVQLVRGQYTGGNIDGKKVHAYLDEEGVRKNSTTETYAAVRLEIPNDRWNGVPFYLRTGKALKHHYAQIAITYRAAPCDLFHKGCPETNQLVIRIQPDEGIKLRFNLANQQQNAVEPHEMTFCHDTTGFNTPQAYELLIGECILGDQTLFTDWAFLQEAWRITDGLRAKKTPLHPYPAGSHGPAEALVMVQKEGRDWIGNSELVREEKRKKKN